MMPSTALLVYLLAAAPSPPLLTEAEEVVAGKLPATAKLLDVRTQAKYDAGHVPGAQRITTAAWSKAVTNHEADAAFWGKAFVEASLDPAERTPLVVMGDDMREVCRAWFLLRYAGVKDVRVFNGTLATFTAAGGKLSTEAVKPESVKFMEWRPALTVQAHKEDVLKAAKGKIIDARSDDEFKAGRVPGAKHLEWSDLLDSTNGKFKNVEAMKKLFADRGIDPGDSPICYCQSGGRASVVAFAVELVSGKPAVNYYRSWSEWGNDPTTPKEK